ncbi:MAG: multifunctional CCA addition/repair protein [Pseudomonadota bacterium]
MHTPTHHTLTPPEFVTIDNADVYLVGGAVRDQLLDIPVKDRDWLVVGATPKQMMALGYEEVGIDFPVYLHPTTHEEYALARTERKSSPGYTGFTFQLEQVTLEDDLLRRDLTINAIAMDSSGALIDPYNGLDDLNNRVLRHVSPAFVEDPLRVLRVARFSAQLGAFGFTLADDTRQLMNDIVDSGELDYLQSERIWQETATALRTDYPQHFVKTLRDAGALRHIFPELDALFGVPQTAKYHPEIDTGIHTLMVMEQSALLSPELSVRFAAMMHDIGKGKTPEAEWPSHKMHEQRSYDMLKDFYKRIPTPKQCQEVANKVAKFHLLPHIAFELRVQTILKLFKQLDAYRKPKVFDLFLLSCIADSKGRTGFEDKPTPTIDYLRACFEASRNINANNVFQLHSDSERPQGKELGQRIDELRMDAISTIKQQWAQQKSTQ